MKTEGESNNKNLTADSSSGPSTPSTAPQPEITQTSIPATLGLGTNEVSGDKLERATTADLDRTVINPYEDATSAKEQEAVESRAQRISSDILEQKREFQSTVFGIILLPIVSLYALFILTVCGLIFSLLPFKQGFPVTGLVFLGIMGGIPTLLSVILLAGLFANKENKDDKDKSSISNASLYAKVAAELLKTLTHK